MAIKLITSSPLPSNYAAFKNDDIQGQDQGTLNWDEPYEYEGTYNVDITSGTDVEGTTITPVTVEIPEADTTNPTKVFWAVVKVLKAVLCPECQ